MSSRFAAVFLSIFFLNVRSSAAPAAVIDEPSKRMTQRIEHVKHIVKDAYEATAKKDRAWDERAASAIDNLVLNISSHPDADGDEPRIMYFKAGEALVAGCGDPLIHFCRAKLLTSGPERIEHVCKAANMLRESNQYGPYIRAYVISFAAWWAQTNQQLVAEAKIEPHIRENEQAVMGLLPEIFADKELRRSC